ATNHIPFADHGTYRPTRVHCLTTAQKKPVLWTGFAATDTMVCYQSHLQDPLNDSLDIFILHLRAVRWHRDRAPNTATTLLDLLDQLGFSSLIALILRCDILVSWAQYFL